MIQQLNISVHGSLRLGIVFGLLDWPLVFGPSLHTFLAVEVCTLPVLRVVGEQEVVVVMRSQGSRI